MQSIILRGDRELRKSVLVIVAGESSLASERSRIIRLLREWGYFPEAHEDEGLNNLADENRLRILIDTNVGLRRGRMQWIEGLKFGAIDAFPAAELLISMSPIESEGWKRKWNDARASLGPPCRATDSAIGKLIALKTDPIWPTISFFQVPYPPYEAGSIVGVEDVPWEEAVDLRCLGEKDDIFPCTTRFPAAPQLGFGERLTVES